jgi:hypothetical protein
MLKSGIYQGKKWRVNVFFSLTTKLTKIFFLQTYSNHAPIGRSRQAE